MRNKSTDKKNMATIAGFIHALSKENIKVRYGTEEIRLKEDPS